MRPILIELEGFGPFASRTVIDFEDVDLGALVGPTGSGKSTVIDAITFALYGAVARYDNTNVVAPIIHQLSPEAKVMLEFETGDHRWLATRVVRRLASKVKGDGNAPNRATTKEARLERVEADGSTTVVAGSVKELEAYAQELTGLDFAQFTRTIVLPQGEFAQFLKDDPSNRQRLLRTLLDIDIYNTMGKVARERAAQAQHQRAVYQDELDKLKEFTPATLDQAKAVVVSLDGLRQQAADAMEEIDRVETELKVKRDAVLKIDGQRDALDRIAVPPAAAEAGQRVTEAASAAAEAAEARDAQRQTVDALRTALDALGDSPLAAIERQIAAAEAVTALAETITARVDEIAAADAEHKRLVEALAAATETTDQAQEALSHLAHAPSAAVGALRADLAVGEPCPVCEQDVAVLPAAIDRAQTEAARRQAESHVKQAKAQYDRARDQVVRAEAHVAQLHQRQQADEAEHQRLLAQAAASADTADAAVPDVNELKRQRGALQAKMAELRAAESAQRRSEAEAKQAEDQVRVCERQMQQFHATFTDQRDAVAELNPPAPETDLIADWETLASWAGETGDDLVKQRTVLANDGKILAGEKSQLIEGLSAVLAPLSISYSETVLADIAAARAKAEGEVTRMADALQRKQELGARDAELAERHAVHESMGKHLSARGFERWLLAEALDTIVAQATQRLRELSAGRYSLEATNSGFQVRDHNNADEARDVRTLSGGETFLASLSLALALADSIAALAPVDAPRLESIFLDEGFGTLDSDTLDVVASAIEELAVGGRMVVLITHVRELAERMPIRFEVARGAGGATVERVEV